MDCVYGYYLEQTSPREIQRQVTKALRTSVAYVRNKATQDLGESHYDPSMDVATAADRNVHEDTYELTIEHDFGCHVCLGVRKASRANPAKVQVTVEHWHGWACPMSGPEKWEEIVLRCAKCKVTPFSSQLIEEQGASTKNNGCDAIASKLRKLTTAKLKAVCAANSVLQSGKKEQLVQRVLAVWKFGSLTDCPVCKHRRLELEYADSGSAPTAVKCKNKRGRSKPCDFWKSVAPDATRTVLTETLRDTAAGDLASVGVST